MAITTGTAITLTVGEERAINLETLLTGEVKYRADRPIKALVTDTNNNKIFDIGTRQIGNILYIAGNQARGPAIRLDLYYPPITANIYRIPITEVKTQQPNVTTQRAYGKIVILGSASSASITFDSAFNYPSGRPTTDITNVMRWLTEARISNGNRYTPQDNNLNIGTFTIGNYTLQIESGRLPDELNVSPGVSFSYAFSDLYRLIPKPDTAPELDDTNVAYSVSGFGQFPQDPNTVTELNNALIIRNPTASNTARIQILTIELEDEENSNEVYATYTIRLNFLSPTGFIPHANTAPFAPPPRSDNLVERAFTGTLPNKPNRNEIKLVLGEIEQEETNIQIGLQDARLGLKSKVEKLEGGIFDVPRSLPDNFYLTWLTPREST